MSFSSLEEVNITTGTSLVFSAARIVLSQRRASEQTIVMIM
jgi:hypothetical protein